ncbi:hypothetical protein GCM10010182_67220 [Actinomadura cremea]|nr:hypothetical protein GCM10010182_67220 [Actinomadura cremea]
MTATILAHVKTLVAELRDQARAAFTTAAGLEQKAAEPAARLTEMAEQEADLMRRLEALRTEMVPVRQAYEALRAEHVHHTVIAEQAARTADYYEATTIPDVERILAAPSAPIEQAPAGPPPPPRDETEHVPTPDDGPPFNLPGVEADGANWLTGGHPLVTATDVAAPAVDGPRHAKPKAKVGTGAFKAITGRLAADEPPAISRKAGVHKAITPTSDSSEETTR